jgi:hypothetical protein
MEDDVLNALDEDEEPRNLWQPGPDEVIATGKSGLHVFSDEGRLWGTVANTNPI